MALAQYRFCILCAIAALALACLFALAPPSAYAQAAPVKPAVSFINDVAPILKENCFACHDAKKRKGKLDMTTYENFRKGGDKEDPIAPGKPDESYLIDAIKGATASRMPPKEAGELLPKEKVALIETWVQQGAALDPGIAPKSDLSRELRIRWKPPAPPAAYPFPVVITALAFTPDNKKIVVGGQHELTIWDLAAGKLEKRIFTRAERAYAMSFLPDGKLAVAGGRPGQEGDVRIYDINAGAVRQENGVAVVDGVNDKAVMLKQLLDADDCVLALGLSPDGKKLAAGGCDRTVSVWDLSGGYANAKLDQTFENHADWVMGVAWSPDAKHLLTASRDKTAKVWDLSTKESALTFPDHQNYVYAVGVKSDGKLGYSVGEDNQIRVWNAAGDQAGKQVRNSGGHSKSIFKIVIHPKQPWLFTCSADQTVRVWNADNGSPIRELKGNTDWVYSLALSPDGAMVASGAWNGEVKIWKTADGGVVKEFNGSPFYKKP